MPTCTAACACGQLRAICDGEPSLVMLCACTQCQRRTGSVYSVAGYFERRQVRTEGIPKRFKRASDAGRCMDAAFCPKCGSTVFWDLEALPDLIGVAAGAFADAGFPVPHLAVWTESKCHWVLLPHGVPTRSKQAPNAPGDLSGCAGADKS